MNKLHMEIICKAEFPDGVEVAGVGKYKKGAVLTERDASVSVLQQLVDGGEWEEVITKSADATAKSTMRPSDSSADAAEEPAGFSTIHKKSKG